jgi:hypothetical protein
MKNETVEIERFAFVGSIGGYTLQDVTGNQWDNALRRIGWREAHNGHLLMRLKQRDRGEAFGLYTMNDFAAAVRSGYSVPSGTAMARIPGNRAFMVIYRDHSFITITGFNERADR